MNNINKEAEDLVNKLTLIRNEFIKNKNELLVSVRKDVVCANLKDILQNSNNYEDLKNKLENYIQQLMNIEKTDNENEQQ